jgi:hypothetical protein
VAEEVNIGNVGGEGVASEVTLANLLAVTQQMAKKSGIDPKDVNKKLKALSTATEDTIKVSTKHRDAQKKNTKTLNEATSALKQLSSAAGGALLSTFGALARSGTEMARAFINGETSMTAFASQLPLVGNQLSILTGLFDNSFAAFQSVATSGAAFNNSLTELRSSAANAYMSLDTFASFIGANSDRLAAFGGTATQGAKAISAMSKQLGQSGMQRDLLNMGFTFEEINESMLDYMYLTRAGNRVRMQNDAALAENTANAAEYAKHQQTLAKLAGAEAKSAQEAIATQMQDVAFQSRLAKMSSEEQAKVHSAMQLAMMTGGQDAVDALKSEFLGMPAVTEGARMYSATMQTQMGMLTSTLTDAQNENITQTQFNNQLLNTQVDLMEANAKSAAEYDTLIRAAGAGVEGSAATIAGFFNNASLKYTDYYDQATGQFSRAIAAEDVARAAAEAANRDATTDTVATFMATVAKLKAAFETSIITPLMEAVTPALNALVEAIRGPIDEAGEPLGESGFMSAITKVGDYINNTLAPGILEFINNLKDPSKNPLDVISGVIKDFFLGTEIQGPLMPGQERDRSGGLIETAIVPLLSAAGDAIVEGVKAWWSDQSLFTQTMIAGAAALFVAGGPLSAAMVAGASAAFGAARNAMRPSTTTAPRTSGPTVGRGPDGRFTRLPDAGGSRLGRLARLAGRGAKFIPGVGLIAAGAMGAFDAVSGFNADPNASMGESFGNAGSSVLNGLTFGLLGRSSDEIAADAANGNANANGATPLSSAELATVNNPTLQDNIDALKSLDVSSVRNYTEAVEGLVEALNKLNEELSQDNDTTFTSRADAGELLSGISASTSGTSQSTEQLNNTMQQVLLLLREMRDLDVSVERNTRNIIGSNLAQGNVSSVGY